MKIGGFFIAVALVLAGCSSDPQPRDPTTSSTPTSTATPPPMPPQASEDGPEGAAAFVSYWVEMSNYAAATGDVGELSRISDPDCSGCQSYIDLYRDTYEAGGYFKGGDWELGELALKVGPDQTFATTTVSVAAGESKTDASARAAQGDATSDEVTFAVSGTAPELTITELVLGDGQ